MCAHHYTNSLTNSVSRVPVRPVYQPRVSSSWYRIHLCLWTLRSRQRDMADGDALVRAERPEMNTV